MRLIDCDISHSPAILAIFNHAILHTTALYEYVPRTPETMTAWFDAKRRGNFPILGAIADDNTLLGFASYGTFRNFPGFKYTVEHSVYVAPAHHRQGFGKTLLTALIERARKQNYHALIGAIDSSNTASVALHEQFNFQRVATMPQVGFKFERWRDLLLYQLLLDTPPAPKDG